MFDGFEVGCAARTIWGEARGEGAAGMRAVAHVLLNRAQDGRWGLSLGAVCLAPYQFSCWNLKDPNRAKMLGMFSGDIELTAPTAAFGDANAERQQGIDPTGGATHYYADTSHAPDWANGAIQTAHIGHHIFFKHVA
jgi:N-acetylmuramoyl-L-alanine amidase